MIEKTVLANGVRVLTETLPHAYSVTMGVWMEVGSRDESPITGGVSHFIEHMAFKGTSKRGPLDIAREIDRLGGGANAFTSKENTCFHAKALAEHLPNVADLLLDIFLNPTYDPTELERERGVILQEINSVEDTPEEMVHVLFGHHFWPDHPLGRPVLGTQKTVSQMSRDSILSYLKDSYSPKNLVLAAVGACEHKQVVDLVASKLESLAQTSGRPKRQPGSNANGFNIKKRKGEQAHILLGLPGPSVTHEDRFSAALLNLLLGGNMSSRLFQEIREKRGLAYSVYSYLSSYSDSGMLGIYMGVDPKSAQKALDVVRSQLALIAQKGLEVSELKRAQDCLKGSILLSAENPESRMGRLARNEYNFGRNVPYEEVIDNIMAVNLDRLNVLAAKMFDPDKLCCLALGPLESENLNW